MLLASIVRLSVVVRVVKAPVLADAPPIAAPSIVPPFMSTVVTIPKSATVLPAFVQLLLNDKLVPLSALIVSRDMSPTFVILLSAKSRLPLIISS